MTNQTIEPKEKQKAVMPGETTKPGLQFMPLVDIYENEKALFIVADLPGVDSENVDIHIEKSELLLTGKAHRDSFSRILVEEYQVGDFTRRFTLTDTIDQENITATMKDGILSVVLPKSDVGRPRKIHIKTS